MATTGHENELINVAGLKSTLQAFKTLHVDPKSSSTALTALANRVASLEAYFDGNEDEDEIINKWHEIVDFINGLGEGESLLAHLNEINSKINELTAAIGTSTDVEFVDLGLPSGTLWAKMNIGAASEKDAGLYFAWGETTGYADATVRKFKRSEYKFWDGNGFTKYNNTDGKTVLDSEDDAASVNLGGAWHMPTTTQINELLNTSYVSRQWTTIDGVSGMLFTSVANGNTLFFPACGNYEDGSKESGNCIWSSDLIDYEAYDGKEARRISFSQYSASSGSYDRYAGYTIRAVMSSSLETRKADKKDTYTKTEMDNKLQTKSDTSHNHDSSYSALEHTHTKSEITDFDHNHDGRYYTETEIDTKLQGKEGTINDLQAIRSNASAGAGASQLLSGLGLSIVNGEVCQTYDN